MLSGEELLTQGKNMVYIDTYELCSSNIICYPRFNGISDGETVPLHMWIESIGQAGEICLRQAANTFGNAMLINIKGVPYSDIKAEDAGKYRYLASVQNRFGKYVKTEIDVLKGDETEFRCSCTHYLK